MYPEGYVRYYNQYGQALNEFGKPGSQADSHFPLNSSQPGENPTGQESPAPEAPEQPDIEPGDISPVELSYVAPLSDCVGISNHLP